MYVGVDPRLENPEAATASRSDEWASKLKAQAIRTSKRLSTASRAAAIRSCRPSVPYSGLMRIATGVRDRSRPLNVPLAPTKLPGKGVKLSKPMRSPFSSCFFR